MLPAMTRITSSFSSPRSKSRTERNRSPSWRKSVEPTCIELGTGPPTSLQWAFTETKPVSRPSQKTGANMATSFRWLPLPVYGFVVHEDVALAKRLEPAVGDGRLDGKAEVPLEDRQPDRPGRSSARLRSKMAQPKSRLSLMMWL